MNPSFFSQRFACIVALAAACCFPPRASAFNLNQDGQTDLVWHLNNGIANYAWLMNTVIYTTNAVNLGNSSPTNWQVVATADFNRNGHTDLLFRDKGSGQNAVWFMTNDALDTAGLITTGDTNYSVVGAGDFNADGLADILWHHNSNGTNVAWFMGNPNGTNFTGIGWIDSEPDTNWKPVAVGDFNNDASADILWRHSTNGMNMIWFMNGINHVETGFIDSVPDLSSHIVATGKFNRLDHTDIVWRSNTGAGANVIWLMEGVKGTDKFLGYATDSVGDFNWAIVGAGGYTNTLALAADASPSPGITVKWLPGMTTTATVKRMGPSGWTNLVTNYEPYKHVTASPQAGLRYEYNVGGDYSPGHPYYFDTGGSYLVTALYDQPIEKRGKVILVVENSMTNALVTELAQLRTNLVGDGWTVIRTNVPRHDDTVWSNNPPAIASIKTFINSNYDSSVTNVVFLIGHVPIPYSGTNASDNHFDHVGAWVADAYYGNTNDAAWTDSANLTNVYYSQATNIAGDKKWDNNFLPVNSAGHPLQLAVGRIDFANLPAFTNKTDTNLLSQYLSKDHRYRTGQITFNDRATVMGAFSLMDTNKNMLPYDNRNDNVFYNARRNATRWFGLDPDKLIHRDIFKETTNSSLWGFLAGSGGIAFIQGDSGSHSTFDLAVPGQEPQTAFYWLNGSWFADWNLTANNNFLRACLATTNYGLGAIGLSQASWTNIPPTPFAFETLALGEPIANGILQTFTGLSTNAPRWLTYLGDPTLRLKMPVPASNLVVTAGTNLSWTAAPGSVVNYFVYRSTNGLDGDWPRIGLTTSTNFTDTNAAAMYQVRAAVITTSGSGSYTNLSQGIFAVP